MTAVGSPETTVAWQVIADPGRVRVVRRLMASLGAPRSGLGRLTRLAADLLDAPVGLLSLINADGQLILGAHQATSKRCPAGEPDTEGSLCEHVVATGRPLVVADGRLDGRLVGGRPIREYTLGAYAAMPLDGHDSYTLGALRVIDVIPRDWTDDNLAILANLAAICTYEIEQAASQSVPANLPVDLSFPGKDAVGNDCSEGVGDG